MTCSDPGRRRQLLVGLSLALRSMTFKYLVGFVHSCILMRQRESPRISSQPGGGETRLLKAPPG